MYADSAYRSAETERKLRARGFRSRIHKRGRRNRPLTEAQEAANRAKSKVRARIEHVFGAQENAPGGRLVRTIGIVRAKVKIGLQNLAYNIRRLVTLERMAERIRTNKFVVRWIETIVRSGIVRSLSARYEKGAMILASNRGFAEWGEVLNDHVVAARPAWR